MGYGQQFNKTFFIGIKTNNEHSGGGGGGDDGSGGLVAAAVAGFSILERVFVKEKFLRGKMGREALCIYLSQATELAQPGWLTTMRYDAIDDAIPLTTYKLGIHWGVD